MKKCLLVIDYQHDFVDGTLGFPKAKTLSHGIEELIKEYHQEQHDVIFTYDTHDQGYLDTQEGRKLPIVHCQKGSHGHELYSPVNHLVQSDDQRYEKCTFGSLDLAQDLKKKDYDVIEIVGLVTNMCVISHAVLAKAACPEAEIIIHDHLCASFDNHLHDQAIDVMRSMQMTIKGDKV